MLYSYWCWGLSVLAITEREIHKVEKLKWYNKTEAIILRHFTCMYQPTAKSQCQFSFSSFYWWSFYGKGNWALCYRPLSVLNQLFYMNIYFKDWGTEASQTMQTNTWHAISLAFLPTIGNLYDHRNSSLLWTSMEKRNRDCIDVRVTNFCWMIFYFKKQWKTTSCQNPQCAQNEFSYVVLQIKV